MKVSLGVFAALLVLVHQCALPQTMVTKIVSAQPVTTYADGTPVEPAIVVQYRLEHRICGETAWVVFADNLPTPSSVRQLDARCHEYAFVAFSTLTNLLPSAESAVLRIDVSPPKQLAAPQGIQGK